MEFVFIWCTVCLLGSWCRCFASSLIGFLHWIFWTIAEKHLCIMQRVHLRCHQMVRKFPSSRWFNGKHGCFQQKMVPQNGWFIRENPIKMDDLGVPLFFGNTHMWMSCDGWSQRNWGVEVTWPVWSLCSMTLEVGKRPVMLVPLTQTARHSNGETVRQGKKQNQMRNSKR